MNLHKRCLDMGGDVHLAALSQQVRGLFQTMNVLTLLNEYPSVEAVEDQLV